MSASAPLNRTLRAIAEAGRLEADGRRGEARDLLRRECFALLVDADPLACEEARRTWKEAGRPARVFDEELRDARRVAAARSSSGQETPLDPSLPILHPALDYQENLAVVGLPSHALRDGQVVEKVELLVVRGSDRRVIPYQAEALREFGLVGKPGWKPDFPFDESRWPRAHLEAFLRCDSDELARIAYKRVSDAIGRYVDLSGSTDPGRQTLLTIWVLATYLFPIFPTFPYLWLRGPKECGKSRLLRVLELLAFNGWQVVQVSPAALFREVERARVSLFADEEEALADPRSERAQALRQILCSGYKRGGCVPRVNPDADRVERFDVFGPRVIASIAGLPDVLEARCLVIPMLRNLPGDMGAERTVSEKDLEWAEARAAAYVLALTSFPRVREAFDQVPSRGVIAGRLGELMKPLLAVGRVLEQIGAEDCEGLSQDLLEFAEAQAAARREGTTDEKTRAVLLGLRDRAGSVAGDSFEVTASEVVELARVHLPNPEAGDRPVTAKAAGGILRRLGRRPARRRGGYSVWEIRKATVGDLIARFRLGDEVTSGDVTGPEGGV